MGKELVSDEPWRIIEPLPPTEPPKTRAGRPRLPDRAVLSGIVFVLKSGIPRRMLPKEMGFGSGVTCWRLRGWQKEGVWRRLHRAFLHRLGPTSKVDWWRASLDAASVPAKGGEAVEPNPTDRAKPGSEHHRVTDRNGIPLAAALTANVHDSRVFDELVDAVGPVKRPGRGRLRKRPEKLHADKGYDLGRCREALRQWGIIPRTGRRGLDSSERLGWCRWVTERTLSWPNRYRRRKVRYERRADVHQAFLSLGCALVCRSFVQRSYSVCREALQREGRGYPRPRPTAYS